jgi:hypothetical protein
VCVKELGPTIVKGWQKILRGEFKSNQKKVSNDMPESAQTEKGTQTEIKFSGFKYC